MRLLLMMLFLASCGDSSMFTNNSRYKFKVDELISLEGQPKAIESNTLDSSYQMYIYEHNTTYQVADEIVIAKYRAPNQNESNIQYWRHKLQDCHYIIETVSTKHAHNANYKLTCASSGQTILYQKNGHVLRISESMRQQNE